jgi:hypothetical protein
MSVPSRLAIRFLAGALSVVLAAALAWTPAHALLRPNVLVVVTDDQRHDELWPMSTVSGVLVAGGASFSNAFVSTPVCCPSRATILSGLYAHHHGLRSLGEAEAFVGPDRRTLATWLRGAGYRTGFFGKYFNRYAQQGPPQTPAWYVPPGWDVWNAFATEARYFDYALVDATGTVTPTATIHPSTRPTSCATVCWSSCVRRWSRASPSSRCSPRSGRTTIRRTASSPSPPRAICSPSPRFHPPARPTSWRRT